MDETTQFFQIVVSFCIETWEAWEDMNSCIFYKIFEGSVRMVVGDLPIYVLIFVGIL